MKKRRKIGKKKGEEKINQGEEDLQHPVTDRGPFYLNLVQFLSFPLSFSLDKWVSQENIC